MTGFAVSVTVVDEGSGHVPLVARLNDPDVGVAAFTVRPGIRRFGWIARDILASLGIQHDVSGRPRNDHENVGSVWTWMLAHPIEHLVVAGVEGLPAGLLADVIELAAGCQVRLWLVADHTLPDHVVDVVDRWPATMIEPADFESFWLAHLADRTQPTVESETSTWPTHIPDSDFPVFLADVRRQLPSELAAAVEELFRRSVTDSLETISSQTSLDEDAVSIILRSLLASRVSMSEVVTIVRAFQVAAFCHGWFVQVDVDQLLASGVIEAASLATDSKTWTALRAYRQPYRPATCALQLADVAPDTQCDLTVSDVSVDGSTVTVDGSGVRVPAGAELFFRALRLERLLEAASVEDLLFVSSDGEPVSSRRLPRAIADARRDLGIAFSTGKHDAARMDARMWRRRHGVSVQQLDTKVAG